MIPKGTIFTKDGMKYMVEEDLYYTIKNGQDYQQTVDSHGVLHINDDDTDQLTVSVPLRPLNAPEPANKDNQGLLASVMDHFLHYLSAVLIPTTGIAYLFHF
jgi:D-alanyl-D-alanine carboxypeptidase